MKVRNISEWEGGRESKGRVKRIEKREGGKKKKRRRRRRLGIEFRLERDRSKIRGCHEKITDSRFNRSCGREHEREEIKTTERGAESGGGVREKEKVNSKINKKKS